MDSKLKLLFEEVWTIKEVDEYEGHIQIQIERQQKENVIRENPPQDTAFILILAHKTIEQTPQSHSEDGYI